MRVTGNIRQIKNSRDSRNKDIAVHLNTVEYITHKKDGKYYQAFDFVEELDTPLVITGDCLALIPSKQAEEGEYAFHVFDKVGEEYQLNENKALLLTLDYDYDANVAILTSATYTITVSNEDFKEIKSERNKARKQKQGKGRKNR
ncbi:hypothetical protein DXT99_13865 [Pontibacter diazotrophicus]|uniref:Uncharacterized protein n=1 Tax=Pontibacter diazotrophicus TaxID=1400979 RepID=A0A3D8LAT4_9BACT|nr:hypothetical protein [Pontibacter diazotrophicus]RDV14487.1 hypothetical protein DXT99_13865 [Pontibacter diazotrophicus]